MDAAVLTALIAGSAGVLGSVGAQFVGGRITQQGERERLKAERVRMLFDRRIDVFSRFQVKTEAIFGIIESRRRANAGDEYYELAVAEAALQKAYEEADALCEEIGLVAPRMREVCASYVELFGMLMFLTIDGDWATGLRGDLGDEIRKRRDAVRQALHAALVGRVDDA